MLTVHQNHVDNNVKLRACLHGGGGPQTGELTCGGSPHLSCKRDQIKVRDYTDRRVTSPTWGPPPPRKQALKTPRILFKIFLTVMKQSLCSFIKSLSTRAVIRQFRGPLILIIFIPARAI